jgi:hypothetical protein
MERPGNPAQRAPAPSTTTVDRVSRWQIPARICSALRILSGRTSRGVPEEAGRPAVTTSVWTGPLARGSIAASNTATREPKPEGQVRRKPSRALGREAAGGGSQAPVPAPGPTHHRGGNRDRRPPDYQHEARHAGHSLSRRSRWSVVSSAGLGDQPSWPTPGSSRCPGLPPRPTEPKAMRPKVTCQFVNYRTKPSPVACESADADPARSNRTPASSTSHGAIPHATRMVAIIN